MGQQQKLTNQTKNYSDSGFSTEAVQKKLLLSKNVYGSFMLGWSKILKSIFKLISNKNQPIKPKLSSVERANAEKTNVFMKILHNTPS